MESAKLVAVAKLYRDALRCAEIVAFQEGKSKEPLLNMVRAAFRNNAALVDEEEITKAKQAAMTGMSNYHAVKAVDLAMKYRDQQSVLRRARVAKKPKA